MNLPRPLQRDAVVNTALSLVLIAALVFIGYRSFVGGSPAPTPAVFAQGMSLADGQRVAADAGKPLFIVVTAAWCGPCQSYKRGTLMDAGIQALLGELTVPIMLDSDRNREDAKALGVMSIPVSIIMVDGREKARMAGDIRADELRAFLRGALE